MSIRTYNVRCGFVHACGFTPYGYCASLPMGIYRSPELAADLATRLTQPDRNNVDSEISYWSDKRGKSRVVGGFFGTRKDGV